jgi:hypothetical protein
MKYTRSKRLIGLFVLVTIAGLSLFLFSPWHRHYRLSAQPCAFTNLEHGSWSDDVAHPISVEPPAGMFVMYEATAETGSPVPVVLCEAPVRAPPVSAA